MKLSVVIPVGPGHRGPARRAAMSARSAFRMYPGPFDRLQVVIVDDTRGQFGRAASRNHGMTVSPDADWYFFLDADDMMEPRAILRWMDLGRGALGVWGIGELAVAGKLRAIEHEIHPMTWGDVIENQNRGTFGIGCFISGPEARKLRFDESVPHCEGFEFCVSFISCFAWKKISMSLAVIDKDMPSSADHYVECPAPWTRAFYAHTMKWRHRGRVPLSRRELAIRHAAENERLAHCSSTPGILGT